MLCYSACVLLFLRSVDGKVRRYDIRFGKLVTDTIGRKYTRVPYTYTRLHNIMYYIQTYISIA